MAYIIWYLPNKVSVPCGPGAAAASAADAGLVPAHLAAGSLHP